MSEEIKNNETRSASPDCCGCSPKPPGPPKPNQCKEVCCDPKVVQCGDISTARCVPILAERIFDCVCLESGAMKYITDLEFKITSVGNYDNDDEICVEKITAVSYDFIGLNVPSLPVIVDNISQPVEFLQSPCAPSATCTKSGTTYTLYNTYQKAIDTLNLHCCENGKKSKIAQQDVEFYVCNLVIYVSGKIGCKGFTAKTDPYSGPLADFGGVGKGFKPVDFLGTICFPSDKKCINMELKFDSCIAVDCVSPTGNISGTILKKFKASILASLLASQQVYVTVKEELVVYTTPNGIVCNKGNISSSCESTCE